MSYKAVFNGSSLCHFNKNHSRANGQFISGDGDGDGVVNDHGSKRNREISYVETNNAQVSTKRKEKSPGKQLKSKGTRQLVGGLLMVPLGALIMNTSDSVVGTGIGWLTGVAGLTITSIGAYNMSRGDRMQDVENAIDYLKK